MSRYITTYAVSGYWVLWFIYILPFIVQTKWNLHFRIVAQGCKCGWTVRLWLRHQYCFIYAPPLADSRHESPWTYRPCVGRRNEDNYARSVYDAVRFEVLNRSSKEDMVHVGSNKGVLVRVFLNMIWQWFTTRTVRVLQRFHCDSIFSFSEVAALAEVDRTTTSAGQFFMNKNKLSYLLYHRLGDVT